MRVNAKAEYTNLNKLSRTEGVSDILFEKVLELLFNLPCFQKEQLTPAQFLESKYNRRKHTYRPVIMNRTRAAVRESADRDLTDDEVDALAMTILDQGRKQPAKALALYKQIVLNEYD